MNLLPVYEGELVGFPSPKYRGEAAPTAVGDFVTKGLWPGSWRSTKFDRGAGFSQVAPVSHAAISIPARRGKELNQLEKMTEAGFVVLIAIATQTREGRTGEPTDNDLMAARLLFNKSFRKTAG